MKTSAIRWVCLDIVVSLVALASVGLAGTTLAGEQGSLPDEGRDGAVPVALWLATQAILLVPEAVPAAAAYKAISRSTGHVAVPGLPGHPGNVTRKSADARYFITSTNIVLRIYGSQACHYLDIPPPGTVVSL